MLTTTNTLEKMVMPSALTIKSLLELLPFFHAIEQRCTRVRLNEEFIVSYLETMLESDFLEPIPV